MNALRQRIKFVAFLFCLWPIIAIVGGSALRAGSSHTSDAAGPVTHEQLRAAQASGSKAVALIPITLSFLAALLFVEDAFRRDYDGPKAWPIAIAIMGLMTFGMASAVYYIGWGYLPTKREDIRAIAFCSRCTEQTLDRASGGVGTHNGIGGRLIGNAEPCDICGSKIKTYWVTFLVPIVPLASYRVLPVGEPTITRAWFLSRKLPDMYWKQIWPNVAIVAAMAGVIGFFLKVG